MTCDWSEWINLGKPTSGPDGGDNESIQKIISAGYQICSAPNEVECRAVVYPGLSISQLGQAVTCNQEVGLVCNNKQQGLLQQCFDYEIRVRCFPTTCSGEMTCDWSEWINLGKPTSGPDGGDNESIQKIISAGYQICSAPNEVECRAVVYPGLSISQLGQAVTCNQEVGLVCNNKQQGLLQQCFDYEIRVRCFPTTCSGEMTCDWSEWINLGKPTSGPDGGDNESIQKIISAGYQICSAPNEVECRAVVYPGLSISQLGQAVTCNQEVGLVCNNKQQGLLQQCFDYEIRVRCFPTTCSGEMTCDWSEWINLGKPTSGPDGGDNESIQKIISAGYQICSAPNEVECRAVVYPGLSISQLGQAVTCNQEVGLVCNNKQQGLLQQCFDYEIRVRC
uniref:mucin-5AC-like n=1 Tax=Centroberyx gerrardi TaxID=166262 RepID=UPI003AACB0F1